MEKTPIKSIQKEINDFNQRQEYAMQEICLAIKEEIENENCNCFVGYFEKDSTELKVEPLAQNKENSKSENEEDVRYLQYYWCEFKKGDDQYRVTMFYKDFDRCSGNIHVLPGAIQVWKKCEDKPIEEIWLKDKIKPKNEDEPYYVAGKKVEVYCEYGWKPVIQEPVFWNAEVLGQFISCLRSYIRWKKCKFKCLPGVVSGDAFYKDVIGYSDYRDGGRGNYTLLHFTKPRAAKGIKTFYYKTVLKDGYGYFTKYDGESIKYEYDKNNKNYSPNNTNTESRCPNPTGPNYYDGAKWIIAVPKKVKDEKSGEAKWKMFYPNAQEQAAGENNTSKANDQ